MFEIERKGKGIRIIEGNEKDEGNNEERSFSKDGLQSGKIAMEERDERIKFFWTFILVGYKSKSRERL